MVLVILLKTLFPTIVWPNGGIITWKLIVVQYAFADAML
jgi:hypothetical protein